MATYTQTKATLDEIAVKSESNRKRLVDARAAVASVEAALQTMQNQYSAFIAEVEADALANPADPAWQAAKAEKDRLVADFLAVQTKAQAIITAFDAE
jgi:hypothetical protein